jgi:hypothetical protein
MKYYEDKLNMLKGGIPQQMQNGGEVSQDYYNPFDEGIAKAITSSRANMGMTQDQEHAALRNSMLAMANSLRQNPLQRKGSVIDNFRTGINALAPAIATYDQTENASLAQNNALAQQILAHKERQEQVTAQEEERLWHRQHAENQLAENKRHHNLLERFKKNKNQQNSYLDQIAPIIRTDSAFDKTGKEAKAAADFYSEVQDVKARYESLKTAMQAAGIDTTNPLAFKKAIREASSVLSSFTKDPKLRAVATKYADVQASNKRAMQTAEKALKDGALTNFTVKYGDQNDLFPNFNEASDIFETKLDHMLHDAGSGYDASELSMQLGRHINKKNYPEIKRWMSEQKQASVQNQNKAAYIPSQVIEGNNSYPVDDIESYFTPYKEE